MPVSGNSINAKGFQSFQVSEGLLQKVTEAVEKGEKQARSSGEVKSFEVFYHGFRQNICIGRIFIVPASVCNKPEEFPIALLYGTVVKLLNLGEETGDLIELHTGSEFDETDEAKEHLKSLKEKAFTVDGKEVSLIVFAPAWSGIREYVAFQFVDDTEKLTNLLRHLVFSCYFNPAVSSGFNALMSTVDTWKLDVTDITPKLTYPALIESPLKKYPELMKAASIRKRIFLTAKTADAIAQNELEPEEMDVFKALGEAVGGALEQDTTSPAQAADKDYKAPAVNSEVPHSDDGKSASVSTQPVKVVNPEATPIKKREAAADPFPTKAMPSTPMTDEEMLAQQQYADIMSEATKTIGEDELEWTPQYRDRVRSRAGSVKTAYVKTAAIPTDSYVVKQNGQIKQGPCSMDECLNWIMEEQNTGIGLSRGGYEIEEAGQSSAAPVPITAAMRKRAGIDPFLASYIETALWSSTDESDPNTGGNPLDSNYSIKDIAPETLEVMKQDCDRFLKENAQLLRQAIEEDDASWGTIAHDFWLTRNRHGAGFWDGDYPATGDALTEAAHAFGEANLYIGDDGRIYQYEDVRPTSPEDPNEAGYPGEIAGHIGSKKKADTADNPANQTKDGEGAMDPKTNKDKPVTAGEFKMEPKYQPRFLTPEQVKELMEIYQASRVALSGKMTTRHERMVYTAQQFSKKHPEVKALAAYKDLDGLLWQGRTATLAKIAYVSHCPGHKNSKGQLAEWCVKSHEDDHIISSHGSEEAAKKHLQDMHAHSGSKAAGWERGVGGGQVWVNPDRDRQFGKGPEPQPMSKDMRLPDFPRDFTPSGPKKTKEDEYWEKYFAEGGDVTFGDKEGSAKTAEWVLIIKDQSGRGYGFVEKFPTEDEARQFLYKRALKSLLDSFGMQSGTDAVEQMVESNDVPAILNEFGEENPEFKEMVEQEDWDGIIDAYYNGEPETYTLEENFNRPRKPKAPKPQAPVSQPPKLSYKVHDADCTCGFCEKKGDIAGKDKEKKVATTGKFTVDQIRAGDRVTILVPSGQGMHGQEYAERTGRAVMRGPAGWVLNMGGRHGTPGIASDDNIVKIRRHKQADTADNPANEAGGKANIIHPKTDAEKVNTRGCEPEMVPDKNPGSKTGSKSGSAWSNDWHQRPNESMQDMFNKTNRLSAKETNGVDFSNGHRNHASMKTADAQMKCPMCKGTAHKPQPESPTFNCQCGWNSDQDDGSAKDRKKGSKTAADENWKAQQALNAIGDFFDTYTDEELPKNEILYAVQTLEGTRNATLESAKLDLERASAMEDFGSAIDWVTSASKKLERFLGAAEGETPMNDADVVADAIAEPLDRGETVASLKSRQAAKKREADLSRKRSSVAEEFGDIFADILPRYGKRADQDVQPDVAEAKAAISGRSKAELANTPDATATTDACELAGQKSAPDAGGVPRVAGDINISVSTDDGKSKVKSKLPLGDGPKSEDKEKSTKKEEKAKEKADKDKKDKPDKKKEKKADHDVQPDISSAREKLDHGAKSQLADNPDAVRTEDACKFAGKTADQSVEPDVAQAKSAIEGKSKAELADNPDATDTVDARELEKQACAPLGDEQDEAIDIGSLIGDLADLGANLPNISGGEADAPQVGEGGLNNLPAKKEK